MALLGYLSKRFLLSILAVLVVCFAVFLMGRATGDPTALLLGSDATVTQQERLRSELGLDRPVYEQYGRFVINMVQGDLGTSIRSGRPVTTMINERMPYSIGLAAVAMAIVGFVGIPLGVIAGSHRGSKWDSSARGLALLGQAVPSFVVGIISIQVFAVALGWAPVAGATSLKHYVLPGITLSLFVLAGVVRLIRSSMLEILDAEYIKLARLKGLSERKVIWKHALRNALLPVVSFSGVYFAILVTLAMVVEVVFSWPGVGRLAFDAIHFRDFPVLQGVVIFGVVLVMLINLVVDFLYALIDPRVRAASDTA